jgi:uncharacterized protein (TIGR02300 family)
MPELKLGTKFECFSCGTKFYDLGKSDPVCPKCGANQKDSARTDLPAVSAASRRRRKADVVKPIDVEEVDAIDTDLDEDVVPEGIEGADLGGDEEEEEDLDDDE